MPETQLHDRTHNNGGRGFKNEITYPGTPGSVKRLQSQNIYNTFINMAYNPQEVGGIGWIYIINSQNKKTMKKLFGNAQ